MPTTAVETDIIKYAVQIACRGGPGICSTHFLAVAAAAERRMCGPCHAAPAARRRWIVGCWWQLVVGVAAAASEPTAEQPVNRQLETP